MLKPDRFAVRLHEIPLAELTARGISGLIVDLDNTLMGFHETELAAEHLAWVEEAHERGFRVVLLSNNFTARVCGIAEQIGVECIPNALKPLPFGFWRALRRLALPRHAVAVVGDQLFTDVLGAKLCGGLYTILTEPIEHKDFALTMLFRRLENWMLPKHRRS